MRVQAIRGRNLASLEGEFSIDFTEEPLASAGIFAISGPTGAGKSTLLNYFCNENVYAENRLFATLDATARKFTIDGEDYLLIDTVGFLRDLPHNLIEAFRSTLESVLNCELAVIVCDAAADFDMQMKTTLGVLRSLNFSRLISLP